MAEEKKPWEQEYSIEDGGNKPWEQEFEVEDTSKKKVPTNGYKPLVEKSTTTQNEQSSPYQDPSLKSKSDSSTLKSTDSTSESSNYSYTFGKPKPVEQPISVSTIGGEAVEGKMSGDKASESVPLAIVQKAGILKQELSDKSKELSLFNSDIEKVLETQKTQYDDLANQLSVTPKEDPAYNYLVEQLNSLSDNANGAVAKLNENNDKINSINKASFMADQAEEVGRNLKVEEDATAGGIFTKSAWNAFAPATIKGIGALTSLTGAVQSPFSFNQADYDKMNAELTNTLGAEKAKEVSTKLTETLNGNKPLQSAGNFIVDLGNKLEADLPESSKGSVLDGFTLNKAMNLAGSGVGSMAAMLLPAGAIGNAGKGAQLATAWGSSSMQTMGGVYDEAKKKGLSDEHAAYLSLAIGLPVGAVDAVTGTRFFGTKEASKGLIDVAIKELSGRAITPTILAEVADKSVKQVLKNKAIDIGSEALTGGVQQVIEETGKAASDKISGKNTFDVTLDKALKNTFDSAFGEAFGAASVGVLNWDGKTTESAYKQALKVNQNQASREYFKKMLETSVANGVIDENQAENIKNNINAIIIANKKIPSNIKDEARLDAIELIKEKTALENEIEGKDKELVAPQLKKIEDINFKLNSIASDRQSVKMERKDLGGKKEVKAAVEKTVAETKVAEPVASNEEIEQIKFNKVLGQEITPEEQAKLDAYEAVKPPSDIVKEPAKGKSLFSQPDENISVVTDKYKKSKGINTTAGEKITVIDEGRSKNIADAYDEMKHDPNNPEVKKAYEDMVSETIDQHKALSDDGYTFEIYEGEGEPYSSSQDMLKDLRENKHLFILSTEKDFGQNKITDEQRQENPLLRDSGIKDINGKPLLANDVFRGVHDAIGHGERGNSFGAKGEENAWDVHSRMYSPLARRAMTTETRGQNSWVNYGKHLRNEDGTIKKVSAKDKPFADQKVGLLPEWASELYLDTQKNPSQTQAEVSNKAKEKFIADGIESLKTMEDSDYDPSNDDVYKAYFGQKFDYQNEKGISKDESKLREKVLSSADNVISALSKVAPGIKVVTHTSKESFGEALGETDTKQSKLGGGFFDPNTNEIHLNLDEIKSNTLFHEGVHPILNVIESINPSLIDKLHSQVLVAEKKAGVEGKYSKEFASRYEESQQKMEAITEFIADVADGKIEVNESNFDKIKQFFVDLMEAIGIDVSDEIKTVGDLKKLAETISKAFQTGEALNATPAKKSTKQLQKPKSYVGLSDDGFVLSFINNGNFNSVGETNDQRVDLSMPTKDVKKAVSDILNGKKTVPATKLRDKILEFRKNKSVPFIQGTGGKTVRTNIPLSTLEESLLSELDYWNELSDDEKMFFIEDLDISEKALKEIYRGIQSQKPSKGNLIANTPKAKYLTEDGEGNYVFYHYSNNDLTKKGIDPNKVGKNIITSRGEKLLAPASFYYTEPNIQEPGVGEYGHVVKVPMDKVYPFNEDPLGLVKIAEERFRKQYPKQAFDANKELAWTSVVAQENGYDMTIANWDGVRGMKGALRAQSPVKLKPELWRKPKEGSYGQVEINEELDYKSNRRKKVQKQEPAKEITDQELKFAIKLLNDKFGGNEVKFTKELLKTDAGKDLLARGISQAVAKKTGGKPSQSNKTRVESVDNRLINSEKISDELKAKIEAAGTQSDVFTNDEAKDIADAYIAENGIDGAVQIADEYLKGSVKMFVYGAAIDQISKDIEAAKTQEEKDALAEKGADVADKMQKNAEEYGRFIQAIGTFYKNSPLIIAKREVNRLEKASQDAFNRMVNKKDKVEKTNQGLNYVKKKNVNPEALNKIKTPKSAKEKTTELTRLRGLWDSLKVKGQRQLSDYSAEQIDVLHRMAIIFYADGKQTFSSLYKTLQEETGISKSDFNELINSKLPSDISADGMSIVDLSNEVNKPLVERVSKDKVEKSDIEKILEAGNRTKSGKSQAVPQQLYAIYAELNKDNKKAMYEDIKNNPDKTEAELLAEWSAELNNQEQQQVIDKYFPEKPTESKKERKAEHEKIIEAYNSGVVNNKAGDKFKELFFDKFGLPKANTEETIKYIDEISKKLAKAPEGSILWRETYEDLLDYIANNAYQNALKNGMDRLSAMWYANILSSPATHLRNLQFNAAQALLLNPLMILEKALLKGDFGQFSNINKGMIEGLKKGVTETGRVFRTGRGTRFDGIMERSIADRKLKFFSPVGRALRGSDIFFSDTAYQLKVREFARAMVKEEHPNWNNDEVNAKVNELMGQTKERKEFASKQAEDELSKFYGENKPKDYETIKKIREFEIIEQTMPENLKNKLEESKNWAKRTLLTNKPTGLFGVVSDLISNLNKNLYVTRFIIPFINVPLNVAQGMIERSPLGLVKAATSNILHEKVSDKFEYLNADQKKELTIKAINYTVAMAILMMLNGDDDDDDLVITGNNTGNYTDDQGVVRGGGLEPMSVYVDGKKIMSYKTSPLAAMLLPVGLMRDSKLYGESKSVVDAVSNSAINYFLFINDASAMQGLQGFLGAIADKKTDRAEAARKWFAKQSNALIPYSGAMKYITNTVNAAKGETDTRPIDMREYIFKDVPLIQDLVGMSTRKDHFGQPVKEKFDVPLLPVGHRGLVKEISDISPYYKLVYEKDYVDDLKYLSSRKFMVGGKEVEISKKELDALSARRGEIVKNALDSKNVFKSKLKSDSKRAELTTLEYLKTLDNETFKMRMDDLFDQAGELARIEKFGEQIGLTKSQIIEYEKALQKIKNPRKRKEEADAPKIRQNRKTLKDYKEKNLEIILESL